MAKAGCEMFVTKMKWIKILRINQRAQNRIRTEFPGRKNWDIPKLIYKRAPWIQTLQCRLDAASKIT